jgi:hypothetical protein
MSFTSYVFVVTAALLLLLAVRKSRTRVHVVQSGSVKPSSPQLNAELKYLTSPISLLAAESFGVSDSAVSPIETSHPPSPFGHLANAWIDFVCHVESQDTVWIVKIPQGEIIASLGTPLAADAHGFAIVRQGRVVNEFFYQRH